MLVAEAGYYDGPADGKFGPQSVLALHRYYRDYQKTFNSNSTDEAIELLYHCVSGALPDQPKGNKSNIKKGRKRCLALAITKLGQSPSDFLDQFDWSFFNKFFADCGLEVSRERVVRQVFLQLASRRIIDYSRATIDGLRRVTKAFADSQPREKVCADLAPFIKAGFEDASVALTMERAFKTVFRLRFEYTQGQQP